MKVEITLNKCRFCKFFECETEDGMDFLDIPLCKKHECDTDDYATCEDFAIEKNVLKDIKIDFPNLVKVSK